MTKYFNSLFQFLASLKLADILLIGFAVLLGIATFYESNTSTDAAQQLIYRSAWFDFLILVLGTNVLCAALSRLPWKKRHIGFVITHLGIIIILVGSLITRKFGVEGQLVLVEGDTGDSITIDQSVFAVSIPRLNVRQEFDPRFMDQGIPAGKERLYKIADSDITCYIDQYHFNPRVIQNVANNNPQPNPAIQIALLQPGQSSDSAGEWLFADSTTDNQLDLGMAVIRFQRINNPEELQAVMAPPTNTPPGPEGQIVLKTADGKEVQTIPVQDFLEKPYPFQWDNKQYEIRFVEFMARSAVQNNTLINRENGALNPVIRFTLQGPVNAEEHIAFAQFPELGSFHGQENSQSGLIAQFIYPSEKFSSGGNEAVFFLDQDGKLHYRATNTAGKFMSGDVTLNTPLQTTWPAVNLSVQQIFLNASKTEQIVDAGSHDPGQHTNPVIHVRLESSGQGVDQYVPYNRPATMTIGTETVTVEFGQKQYPLGFNIKLVDFQAPRYPGTNRPARFQSLVKLIDPQKNIEEEKLVYMNNPLAYNRFLVYQSGYEEGKNGGPDTSIFSVAWAPGTSTIYIGSLVLCLGMVFMYITRRTISVPNKSA